MMPKQSTPMAGVMTISSAGRMEMKVTETPARVPSSAARGVIRRTQGATKPPAIRMKLWTKTQASPASQPRTGSPVCCAIGSMMTSTTTNMCGTEMPEGSAQTSSRPLCSASRRASQA
jgi:hypothetical protein